jgi:WD40 repeat protein
VAKGGGRVAFSSDGTWLARTDGAQVVLMDAATGRQQKQFRCPAGVVRDVAFAGGLLYATNDDGTLRAWDVASGEARGVRKAHDGAALTVAVSPDGQLVASAGTDGLVRLWQANTLKEWAVLRGHKGAVEGLAFADAGKLLMSAGVDGSIRGWDVNRKAEAMVLTGHAGGVYALACPRERLQALSAGEDRLIRLWDLQDRKMITWMGLRAVFSLSCVPSGRVLALGRGSELALRDLERGEERLLISGLPSLVHVACSDDGKLLAASVGRLTNWRMNSKVEQDVWILDAVTGKQQRVLKGHEGGTVAVAFSPNGKLLAAGALGPSPRVKVRLWDLESGQVRQTLTHQWSIASLAFSPDGTLLAVGTSTIWTNVAGELRLWDVATGKETARLEGHRGGIFAVAFSPDGKVLASAGQDCLVKVWDMAGHKLLHNLEGSSRPIAAVAFAPDGSRLAAAGQDGILRLWETESYNEVGAVRLSDYELETLAFTSDGRTLAVGCRSYVAGDELRLLHAEDPDERRASAKRENP